jgi:hypothetical protein
VLSAVHELHKAGFQGVRIMLFMWPSGEHWRCWLMPRELTAPNHGARLTEATGDQKFLLARYSSGQENEFFSWTDTRRDAAGAWARKIIERFPTLEARVVPRLRGLPT